MPQLWSKRQQASTSRPRAKTRTGCARSWQRRNLASSGEVGNTGDYVRRTNNGSEERRRMRGSSSEGSQATSRTQKRSLSKSSSEEQWTGWLVLSVVARNKKHTCSCGWTSYRSLLKPGRRRGRAKRTHAPVVTRCPSYCGGDERILQRYAVHIFLHEDSILSTGNLVSLSEQQFV